ncbi:MAG: hypothetical protein ACKPKO_55820 [Candidatus Fonsibacter sp.]
MIGSEPTVDFYLYNYKNWCKHNAIKFFKRLLPIDVEIIVEPFGG